MWGPRSTASTIAVNSSVQNEPKETIEPNCVKSISDVFTLAALFYKLLDDVEIITTSMRETLGVVQDEAKILLRGELFLDIASASFAAVLHSLQLEVSKVLMTLSA